MDSISAKLVALPGNVRGALWILLSAIIFTMTNSLIKYVGSTLDPFQMVFFRGLFGTMFLLPIVWHAGGMAVLKTQRRNFHLARGITGSLALMTIFYALTNMPLADVMGISFSRSLWVIILAVLFLGERIRWRRWTATLVGFCGVLVMVRPGPEANPAAIAAVLNALFVAMSVVLIKRMTVTEKPLTILFWGTLIPTFVTLPPAIIVWETPTNTELMLMAAIGESAAWHAGRVERRIEESIALRNRGEHVAADLSTEMEEDVQRAITASAGLPVAERQELLEGWLFNLRQLQVQTTSHGQFDTDDDPVAATVQQTIDAVENAAGVYPIPAVEPSPTPTSTRTSTPTSTSTSTLTPAPPTLTATSTAVATATPTMVSVAPPVVTIEPLPTSTLRSPASP